MTEPSTCPRCGQEVTFRKDGLTIYPHRDRFVQVSCPMGGVEIGEAQRQVNKLRAQIRAAAERGAAS